tara:strand:+ start:183 stop:323 length:141 start_codon:yes stop_codon:yes gene_type:complete
MLNFLISALTLKLNKKVNKIIETNKVLKVFNEISFLLNLFAYVITL